MMSLTAGISSDLIFMLKSYGPRGVHLAKSTVWINGGSTSKGRSILTFGRT